MINLSRELMNHLQKETSILLAQIRALYQELDRKFHLHGADLPVNFTYDTDRLGSYTAPSADEEECFTFSLLFIGYSMPHPLSKEDRLDLYRHEYAHYMAAHMNIPQQYRWQSGLHGSAWKYCCSLIGAAPTPFYKAGESQQKHDYEKALKPKVSDRTIPIKDQYRRLQEAKRSSDRMIRYAKGDTVTHPSFGEGIVEEVEQLSGSVRLHIRFGSERKKIDQKWLLRQHHSAGTRTTH